MKLNAEWHNANPMPKNPTMQERVQWHKEHAKECGCRPIPKAVQVEIDENKPDYDFPRIGMPATNALLQFGVTKVEQLAKYTCNEIAELHGMGPKALGILEETLKAKGLGFKKE